MKLFMNAVFEEKQFGRPFVALLLGTGTCQSNKNLSDWVWGTVGYTGRKSGGFLVNLSLQNFLSMNKEGELLGFRKDLTEDSWFDIQFGKGKFPCRVVGVEDRLLTIKESDLKKLSPTPALPMPNAPNDSVEMKAWLKDWLNQIVKEFGE